MKSPGTNCTGAFFTHQSGTFRVVQKNDQAVGNILKS